MKAYYRGRMEIGQAVMPVENTPQADEENCQKEKRSFRKPGHLLYLSHSWQKIFDIIMEYYAAQEVIFHKEL